MVTQQLVGRVVSGLADAATRTASGQANAACVRWFGDSSDQGQDQRR